MPSPPVLSAVVLLSICVIFQWQASLVSGFEFDHDVDARLCEKEISKSSKVCTSNSTMWFSCPISCADALHGGRGTMAEERNDPEQFYELHVEKVEAGASYNVRKGTSRSLEDNEGYITMYAVLPMLPGMAEYYYHAIEHIAQVYKYTVVAMILPYYDTTDENHDAISILESIAESRNAFEKPKSILLTGYDARGQPDNEVLEYLQSREVVAGTLDPRDGDNSSENDDDALLLTRPNIFLVSHTGMFIERVVSPTMKMIERRIKVHELAMKDSHEL